MNWLKIEKREFDGKKREWRGRESKKNFYFVWLKLQIETKMRKGKYYYVMFYHDSFQMYLVLQYLTQ
jgi:hypothetical protein